MAANDAGPTAEPEEIARFEAVAEAWWDTEGEFKPLHRLNPPRLAFLRERLLDHFGRDGNDPAPFAGLSLLDVGCGGGLIAEPLARLGFAVTAIDAGQRNIDIAKAHAKLSGLAIDYRAATPEAVTGQFDVVTAMEVIEHVPDPGEFMAATAARLKAGGAFVGATLNRTPQSFALAIIAAERVLRWLPKGTHQWRKFVRPSEMAAWMRATGIKPLAFSGLRYDPLRDRWVPTPSLDVNYLVYGKKN